MKKHLFYFACASVLQAWAQPIALHPENGHYFIYNNKPTVLVASCEHYGSVINPDFNYTVYLETIANVGLNHTRIFGGDYVEDKDAFCITYNTLAPEKGRFLAPWQRSNKPGFALGGNKFNLDKWDEAYFKRLHRFMTLAQEKGIVVEFVLFFVGPFWHTSPFHTANNINNTTSIAREQYMTLNNGTVGKYQELYVKKLVRELNKYPNLILNVANEPWFDNQAWPGFASPPPVATLEWIQKVSEWITETEKELPNKHLISVDYSNEGFKIPLEHLNTYFKNISVFNHHYDKNAESTQLNYGINRALSFNETGIMPMLSPQYRMQGWKYFFTGGALYNNLDFTFFTGYEKGNLDVSFSCTWYHGCGHPTMKHQMAALLKFMHSIDFVHMQPDNNQVYGLIWGDRELFTLVKPEIEAVYYITPGQSTEMSLTLKKGKNRYELQWINPIDAQVVSTEIKELNYGAKVAIPMQSEDAVLKVKVL